MEWTVNLGKEQLRMRLPAQLVAGEKMTATLQNGRKIHFVWEPRLKSLVITDNKAGLERCLSLRSARIQAFPFEASCVVELEVAACPALTVKANVSPLASGEAARKSSQDDKTSLVRSPMTGKVLEVLHASGHQVEAGQALVIVEAMKMENKIFAPKAGKIEALKVKAGDLVQVGAELVVLSH